ncbi:MAG: ATP-grasp domain-containing protein, partial [Acidobacteria bacterium]|nr:ATP-grasp domain-containing protein [Acidobacteriota bacterium]
MLNSLLIANRGEIAIRVMRAAAELGIRTVAVYAEDDRQCLHVLRADTAVALSGTGPAAYLDLEQILRIAGESSCAAIHPGYGFLSENAAFARSCGELGLTFVGPGVELLELFGDKARARRVASENGVPVLEGSAAAVSVEQAREFFASLGEGRAMMVKAVAGGGGRGVRIVRRADDIEAAFERCRSEARSAFGSEAVYVEELLEPARHIEVQIVGDGRSVLQLGERECSIQRRHQKLVEMAPAAIAPELRERILESAVRLAAAVGYDNVGTFEFLVDGDATAEVDFAFIEANARLQVEHTVTEEISGVDLVQLQLQIAGGSLLDDITAVNGSLRPPRGVSVQARVNMETMDPEGAIRPSGGTLEVFEPPSGPGIRVDTFGYSGYPTSPRYDSLLAKVICHQPSGDHGAAFAKLARALGEFRIEGVSTNLGLLRAILQRPEVTEGRVHTRFIDDNSEELARAAEAASPASVSGGGDAEDQSGAARAGVQVDASDPLAVLDYGRSAAQNRGSSTPTKDGGEARRPAPAVTPDGTIAVLAPVQGTIVTLDVVVGDTVGEGQQLLVMEAM